MLMCTQPLLIKNRKLSANTFMYGVDKKSFYVPCGHCEQCRAKKVNDLLVRGYYEYLDTLSKGGFTIFQTLTYSEVNVPKFQGFRFFRKKDLQDFLKRLRTYLKRDGYDVEGHFKYIITSEYGENTFRCHYHFLGFCTILGITPSVFDSYISRAWKTFDLSLDEANSIGFVDNNCVDDRVVNSIFGIRYVVKYIGKGSNVRDAILYHKGTDFYNYFIEWCRDNNLNPYNVQDWQISHFWNGYKTNMSFVNDFNLMPFCLQSNGIGLSFLRDVDFDSLLDKIYIVCQSPKGFKEFSVPLYYIRKVFYHYDKDTKRFILNDNAKIYLDKKNKLIFDSYKNLFNIDNTLIDKIVFKVSEGLYNSFKDMCDDILIDRSYEDFVYYCVYLQDINVSPIFEFLDLPSLDARTLGCIVYEYSLDCYIKDSLDYTIIKKNDLFNSVGIQFTIPNEQFTFNQLPQFNNYDLLSCYINKITSLLNIELGNKMIQDSKKDIERIKAIAKISALKSVIH